MFGRKKVEPSQAPLGASAATKTLRRFKLTDVPVDSDGKRRVIGERVVAEHRSFLDAIGFDINAPENILPTEDDHRNRLAQSIDSQKARHASLEAALVAKHGYAMIWPYHVFGDPVWNGPDGLWLMRSMQLLPADEWNVVYFASDRRTSALIDLPVHPGGGIAGADEAAVRQVARFRAMFDDLLNVTDPIAEHSSELLQLFVDRKAEIRQEIIDYSALLSGQVMEVLWDATRATA